MREVPPTYHVRITEVTSKRTILNTIYQGQLGPQLRDDGALMERIADADRRRYWKRGKTAGRA